MTPSGIHPVAAMFPAMPRESKRFADLVESIEARGLLDPIVLDAKGQILDGRNRLAACELAQIEPRFVAFSDVVQQTGFRGDEDDYAYDRNIARRDLSDDQRVTIVARFMHYKFPHAEALHKQRQAGKNGGRGHKKNPAVNPPQGLGAAAADESKRAPDVRQRVAEEAGVSEHKARQALDVARADDAVAEEVVNGDRSLCDAHKEVTATKANKPRIAKPVNVEKLIDKQAAKLREQAALLDTARSRKHFAKALIEVLREIADGR